MEQKLEELTKHLSVEYEKRKGRLNEQVIEKINEQRKYFTDKFSKEKLAQMNPAQALENLMNSKNRESLVYHLEFKNDEHFYNKNFGSISGGSAGKFIIFYSNKFDQWVKWSNGQVPISTEEAENIAYNICQNLIKLHRIIDESSYETLIDVQNVIKKIESEDSLASFYGYAWVHKYFHLFYPHKICFYHGSKVLRNLFIKIKHPFAYMVSNDETHNSYILDYFYIDLATRLNIDQHVLSNLLWDLPGIAHKTYFKVDILKYSKNDLQDMISSNFFFAPININEDLTNISSLEEMRKYIKSVQYTEYNALEVNMITKTINKNDFIVLVDNNETNYIGIVEGNYEYVNADSYKHRIPITWYSIKDSQKFTLSGNSPRLIKKIKRAKDQVDLELSISAQHKIVKSHKKELKPLKGIMKEIYTLLSKKKQIILTGAPGTGKTHWSTNTVYELIARQYYQNSFDNLSDDQQKEVKQSEYMNLIAMHSNYGYEEFVEGLRPENVNGELIFKVKNGVFKEFAERASQDLENNYYIILDEINRTDLTKVFGELIYSIENTKRGESIELSISNDKFTVPNNLYLIGTMNNADKSVSLIDLALRRRFGFIELTPDYDLINTVITDDNKIIDDEDGEVVSDRVAEDDTEDVDLITEINISHWLQDLNNRIINSLGSDGKDLQIGHSYFLSKGEVISEPKQFIDVLKYEIIPLLEEYTYNNTHQLKEILGNGMFNKSNDLKEDLLDEAEFANLIEALVLDEQG